MARRQVRGPGRQISWLCWHQRYLMYFLNILAKGLFSINKKGKEVRELCITVINTSRIGAECLKEDAVALDLLFLYMSLT